MENLADKPVTYSPPATFTLAGYKPWVTTGVALLAIALCIGINTEPTPLTWASYARWGGPNAQQVWDGAYWGLLTSNFLHVAIWHLAFNLYWLWILGRKIEFEQGWRFMLGLVLTAAWVAGAAELAAGVQGIGLSGVVYALFGYCWVRARTDARFRGFLTPAVVRWIVGWLLLCLVLTQNDLLNVGNAAHVGGLVWGAAVAWLQPRPVRWRYGLLAVGLVLAGVPLAWAPWTVGWLTNRAYALHRAQRLPEARQVYEAILQREPTNEFARTNLTGIRVYDLGQRAQQLAERGDTVQAQALCRQILQLEPSNAWARAALGGDTLQAPLE